MRVAIQQLRISRFSTKGKAQHLHLDDFERYLEAKRWEVRATIRDFWVEFLLFLLLLAAGGATLIAFLIAAPVLRSFFFA